MRRSRILLAALVGACFCAAGASAFSPEARNGRIAFVHIGNKGGAQIYTFTGHGTARRQLTRARKASSLSPMYSPNGHEIAFVRAGKQSDIWTMDVYGGDMQNLTRTPTIDEVDPTWSPNGQQIAFAVTKPAALTGIWVIGWDGRNRHQVATGPDTHPSWSPDGSEIAYQWHDIPAETDSIYVVAATGGTPTDLSDEPAGVSDLDPAWSPDGTKILFVSDRPDANQLDLWTMNADGSDIQRVTNTPNRDESDPAWSPDGRYIVYSGEGAFHGASSSQIYVSRADGTGRRILTHAPGDDAIINESPSWQFL